METKVACPHEEPKTEYVEVTLIMPKEGYKLNRLFFKKISMEVTVSDVWWVDAKGDDKWSIGCDEYIDSDEDTQKYDYEGK